MKKYLIGVLIIVSCFLVSASVANAAFNLFFGGEIVSLEAPEISKWENGYDCILSGGTTIEISSVFGPTSYYIPAGAIPVTNTIPTEGQGILGLYGEETPITCTRDEEESGGLFGGDEPTTSQITIYLPSIRYFGTSQI